MSITYQNRDVESTQKEAIRLSRWLEAPVVPATSEKKILTAGWTSLGPTESRSPAAVRKFKPGQLNIAVVLGGNLYSIDADDEDFYSEFLLLNPWLSDTLFSTGSGIGGNFWFRPKGACPKTTKLTRTNANGGIEEVGEVRAVGCATIIHGFHAESRNEYWHNRKEPMVVEWEEIIWPKGIHPFNPEIEMEDDPFTERTEEDRRDRIDTDDVYIPGYAITSVGDAIMLCTPKKRRSTDKMMFKFCRALKALELTRGSPLTKGELVAAFDEWYVSALRFLKRQPRSRYQAEFVHRFGQSKVPLGRSKLLSRAIKRAEREAAPAEAAQFDDDPVLKRLVCLLYYLQAEAGDKAFWISTRDCGRILGVSHSQAAKWLSVLASPHYAVTRIVIPYTTQAAPRLRYINFPQLLAGSRP